MLTAKENSWNMKTLEIISALNILPIQIEKPKYGRTRIQIHTSKARRFLWKCVFSLAILHLMFNVVRFIQSLVQPELFRLDRIVIHFLFIMGSFTEYYNGYCAFIKSHDEYIIISNQLFNQEKQQQPQSVHSDDQESDQENEGKTQDEARKIQASQKSGKRKETSWKMKSAGKNSQVRIRPWLKWPVEYSLQESMTLLMPFIAVASGSFSVLILGVDPSRPQLLYSILPEKYQNWSNFVLLLSVEVLTFSQVVENFYLSNFTQLEFFENIQYQFEQVIKRLRDLMKAARGRKFKEFRHGNQILGEILVEIRQLKMFIRLFNSCFPFCIFAMKLFYMSDSIFGYFLIIRHFKEQRIYATFSGYIALLCTTLYSVVYSNAFIVPQNMDRVKRQFLMAARQFNGKNRSSVDMFPLFVREIRRFRNVGIRVGNFQNLERECTPNFIDFVVKQLVSLLVTIPR